MMAEKRRVVAAFLLLLLHSPKIVPIFLAKSALKSDQCAYKLRFGEHNFR